MKSNFFTAYWNSVITVALGIVALFFIMVFLNVGVSIGSFIGLVVIVGGT
jgi:hypothetical protein